jgi:hypothetical protein
LDDEVLMIEPITVAVCQHMIADLRCPQSDTSGALVGQDEDRDLFMTGDNLG